MPSYLPKKNLQPRATTHNSEKISWTGTSEFSGFYKLSAEQRVAFVRQFAALSDEEAQLLAQYGALGSQAERMIENVIGTLPLPLGVAVNFRINGADRLVPMAIEEPSVVAAASNSAKLARLRGGFFAKASEPVMIGQVQLTGVDAEAAKNAVLQRKQDILALANAQDPVLVKFGGGCRDIEARVVDAQSERMLVLHLLVDVRDAMGANAVNTMCEAIAPLAEEITGGSALLRIISNLATHRTVEARAVYAAELLGNAVPRIVKAYELAEADAYRAATHNKGVMNGVDAVVLATGNDWRAVEAGVHAYASLSGAYKPVTKWRENAQGDLEGSIKIPLALGLVGGATKTHPVARLCVKILGVKTAQELAEVIASVGLAQNFAALRALATEGIQRGHMELHARNVAIAAGASGALIERIAQQMIAEKRIRADRAKELLEQLMR
jgi:hydroxymethylglutaryl-CoA reductase